MSAKGGKRKSALRYLEGCHLIPQPRPAACSEGSQSQLLRVAVVNPGNRQPQRLKNDEAEHLLGLPVVSDQAFEVGL
ncbi:hypothetical protein D3C87_2147810 [compost metagenome]